MGAAAPRRAEDTHPQRPRPHGPCRALLAYIRRRWRSAEHPVPVPAKALGCSHDTQLPLRTESVEIRTSTAFVRPYTAVHRLGGALVYGPCTRPSCPGARAPPGELSRTARTRGDGMRAPPDNCPGQPVLPYTPYITYTLTIRTRSVQPRTRRTAPVQPVQPVHTRTRSYTGPLRAPDGDCALPTLFL